MTNANDPMKPFWISLLRDANSKPNVIDSKYHLKELLGSGGEGAVCLASEVFLDELVRYVAVKLRLKDEENLDGQKQEIITTLNINHPYLIRCFTAGQCKLNNSDLLYLVMERGEETLTKRLPLSEKETLEVVQSIGSVLVYLHDQGIAHRDVKPDNVLRVDEQWKLSDFGLVREVGCEGVRTSTLNIKGSPGYAPPESYEGDIFLAWDIWSLGVMIAEMLTGKLPFEGKITQHLQTSILKADPVFANPLPSPFDEIVRGCLIKNPNERWTAEQVLESLNRPRATPRPVLKQRQISQPGFDYCGKLRRLLEAQKWEEADRETFRVMLQIAKREDEGKLTIESINNFPSEILRTIDQLWVKSSNGRFGFSVQKQIWQELAGQNLFHREPYEFGARVGWYVNNSKWLGYHTLTFDIKAPQGHLPNWHRSDLWTGIGTNKGVSVRVGKCGRTLFDRLDA